MKNPERLIQRFEWSVAIAATMLAVWLHITFLTHAGGLWRDEAGGVQLATQTSLSEMWRMSPHQGSPLLFPALVRIWSTLSLGASDFGLRVLGFLIGLGLLGTMWANARLMGARLPLVSLGLLATNLAVVRWGDSLRAYGCASLFILVTLGLIWQLSCRPSRTSFLFATLAAVLSVHTLYQNAFLVLAACISGGAVCAKHKQWRTLVLVLGVGVIAGVSLLPCVPLIIQAQEWLCLYRVGFEMDIETPLFTVLGGPANWPVWIWGGLLLPVLGAGLVALQRPTRSDGVRREDLPLFGAVALLSGVALIFAFFRLVEMPVEPWYFVPPMVFAATAMEAALADWSRKVRFWPSAFVAVLVCVPLPATLKLAAYRQTSVDLIAGEIQRRAQPGDFIVVCDSCYGVTFGRYFKGTVAWVTVPPVEDHRFHREDLLKAKFSSTPDLKNLLQQIKQTLASGHQLWLVGDLPPAQQGAIELAELPPLPSPGQPFGHAEACAFTGAWQQQTMNLIAAHAEHGELVTIQTPTPVNPYENLPLVLVTGWRAESANPAGPP